ncbi:MAG TPA: hypothetical protein VM913_06990 [Sphingomicrobium sp.]|nr:hypothetical protein [Sphingomicrobium sp.]
MNSPPRLRFGLTVGVTGHRAETFSDSGSANLSRRLAENLKQIEKQARAVHAEERKFFTDEAPAFTLVSPLASGADQIAAAVAVEAGWSLQAVLPMTRADYVRSMSSEEASEVDRLSGLCCCVLELPGDPNDAEEAFVMAGRATVAHCDLLIAVWDGLPARGRGGTADTVALALTKGTPILHLPVAPEDPSALMWSAFDPVVITAPGDRACRRRADDDALLHVLRALIAPPTPPIERKFIRRFYAERPHEFSLRFEYPLLLTLAGTHRLSSRDLRAKPKVEASRAEWRSYRQCLLGQHGVDAPLDWLQEAYEWSDRLATHFAQTYRSGHVFNFLLAALGAWIGLAGLILPANPLPLAVAEFIVVLAVVVNTLTGSKRCWHQRWLDYRQLAERLRPMRSMKLLGIAAPDPPGSAAEPVARRWIDWYAASAWRTVGCPSGRLTASELPRLAASIAEREVGPQIAYNRRNAEQVGRFDRRLEVLALLLFMSTLAVTACVVLGLELSPELVTRYSSWITALSAGLPALGTAIFGIRVHGDYSALAARSRSTAGLLERIADDLRQSNSLPRVADLTEQAGRVMLADLGEWRLVNELHDLSLA